MTGQHRKYHVHIEIISEETLSFRRDIIDGTGMKRMPKVVVRQVKSVWGKSIRLVVMAVSVSLHYRTAPPKSPMQTF